MGFTLTILGCGSLGTEILSGILNLTKTTVEQYEPRSKNADDVTNGHGQIPTRFNACTKTSISADRVRKVFQSPKQPLAVFYGDENIQALKEADVVILGCKPNQLRECLDSDAMRRVLNGKLLISILAGVSIDQINAILEKPVESEGYYSSRMTPNIYVCRAMPNTAAGTRQSTTLLATSAKTNSLTQELLTTATSLLQAIGTVTIVPESQYDACTALCGSTPAFLAVVLEALIDGAVTMGVPRARAQELAANTMKGTGAMVASELTPQKVRELTATPGGSTAVGLLRLEEGRMRYIMSQALIDSGRAAGELGKKE